MASAVETSQTASLTRTTSDILSAPAQDNSPQSETPPTVVDTSSSPEVAPAAATEKQSTATTLVEKPTQKTAAAAGVLMLQNKLDGVYTYVKDGFVYIYGKINDSYVCIKVKEQAITGYNTVKSKTVQVAQLTKTKTLAVYDITEQKLIETYARLILAAQKVPVPMPIKNGAMYVSNKGAAVALFIKGKTVYVQGQIGNAVLAVKVRGVDTFDLARTKALDTYNAVAKKTEPYLLRAQDGFTSVKGRIQDTVVSIKSRGESKALDAFNEIKAVIERLPMTAKIQDGMTVVKGKFSNITVYVKDGCMYGVSQIGDATYFVRAKVSAAQDLAQVKILEAYSRTRSMSDELMKYVLSLAEATRAKADKKPVTAGATCGAMLGGAGGGTVGGIAGGIAGGMAGLPLALFTFGLSIPVGAVLGGGVGASAGAVTGGAAGVVTGGTAGYGYGRRDEIKNGVQSTLAKAGSAGTKIQGKVMNQVEMVKERLVSGTGSTA